MNSGCKTGAVPLSKYCIAIYRVMGVWESTKKSTLISKSTDLANYRALKSEHYTRNEGDT